MTLLIEPPASIAGPGDDSGEQTCRVCGCTDWNGCEPACWWIEDDLCSSCEGKA